MPDQPTIENAPELPRRGPPPIENIERNDPFGLRVLSFRRYSVRHMSLLLCATGLSAAVTAHSLATGEWTIAALAAAAFAITALTMFLMARMALRRVFVERWIRRLGMGDFEYTVRPWSDDELSKVCVALETLRRSAVAAMQLDEVRRLSDELQQKNADLETALEQLHRTQDQIVSRRKLAELGELSAGVAHELSNPLQFVRSFSQANQALIQEMGESVPPLLKHADEPDAADIAEAIETIDENSERIIRNVDRATRILSSMMSMSSNLDRHFQDTYLNQLVEYQVGITISTIESMAPDGEFPVEVSYRLHPSNPVVNGIPEDLARVVSNIVKNGVQAAMSRREQESEDYVPEVVVATDVSAEQDTVISITDNGVGIEDDVMPLIFNPFFTTRPPNEGTGLGLSSCHDIVREHGGSIEVETRPGYGTTFKIRLPTENRGE